MVSCCRRLGVRSLFLTSRHGQVSDIPVNLYQMNFILCSYTNGQSSKAQRSASKAPVLAERRQISAGSSFRARLPHPAPPSSLREPASNAAGPRSPQVAQAGSPGLTDCEPDRQSLLLVRRGRDGERLTAAPRPGPRLVEPSRAPDCSLGL